MTMQEEAPGSAPARKNRFDEADRERIRATLFRYTEEHRIGVPTLISHMAKAVKREARYIPQKTLQRFLEGRMRTNDAAVAIFYEFAQTLPPARDEVAELGLALGQFFRRPEVPADAAKVQPAPVPCGLFQTYAGPIPHDDDDEDSFKRVVIGYIEVASRSPETPVRIQERIYPKPLREDARPAGEQAGGRGEHFDGVLACFDTFQVAVLRSTATRRPRTHWFWREEGTLQSSSQGSPTDDEPRNPIMNAGRFLHFEPIETAPGWTEKSKT